MTIDDFIRLVESDNARLPGVHVLAPGVSEADYQRWSTTNAPLRLPSDALQFWFRSNGCCLWRQAIGGEYISNGYLEFYCLEEIRRAGHAMYDDIDHCPKNWIALATEQDGTFFIVLDSQAGTYLRVEPIMPDEAKLIASSFEKLLDYLVYEEKLVGGELPVDSGR